MDALQAILTRRSIRKYTSKAVSEEMVRQLLEAGMSAPSAGNQQPWHFVVFTDHAIMDQISKFHRYSEMLKQAQVAILVCADLSIETHAGYWVIDCSAATENILIAAHALGLGAVWLGIYPREERVKGMIELLKLPETIMPHSLISIGYPGEKKGPANRFHAKRVHYNTW
jgi:nitroreductase